jgi:hypothetical protein
MAKVPLHHETRMEIVSEAAEALVTIWAKANNVQELVPMKGAPETMAYTEPAQEKYNGYYDLTEAVLSVVLGHETDQEMLGFGPNVGTISPRVAIDLADEFGRALEDIEQMPFAEGRNVMVNVLKGYVRWE